MTSRVKLLPEELINRIAAGEVVERPASILKELLENSLDSGADKVDILCEKGGKNLVRVSDNGSGMNEEELYMCLERHATSKLDKDSDLSAIHTLGFRGEALPSIASVSKLSITSSTGGEAGNKIVIEGGKLIGLTPVPANKGTIVEAADLFFNVPARRKFLKSDHTEELHLVETVERYALSRPELSITLTCDSRTVVSATKDNDYTARLVKILGDGARDLISFSQRSGSLKVSGHLGRPEASQRSAGSLYIFVLGRPVKDRLLTRAIIQGYGRTLPNGRYPIGVIFLNIDPADVDVNVHPAKTEVRFRDTGKVFSLLATAVSKAISISPLASSGSPPPYDHLSSGVPQSGQGNLDTNHMGVPPTSGENHLKNSLEGKNQLEPFLSYKDPTDSQKAASSQFDPELKGPLPFQAPFTPVETTPTIPDPKEEPRSLLPTNNLPRAMCQLQDTYILAAGGDGLHIIDQHAAHERILINRLKKAYLADGIPAHNVLLPDTFSLTMRGKRAFEELEPQLKRLGFILEPFGGSTYILKGIPLVLEQSKAKEALLEILHGAEVAITEQDEGGLLSALKENSESWFHSMACRAAIKAGHSLKLQEMDELIKDMAQAESGGFCPHGRPSSFVITYSELEKRFGRK